MDEEKNKLYDDYDHAFFELPPLERHRSDRRKAERPELWKILLAVLLCLLFGMAAYFVGQVYGAELIPNATAGNLPDELLAVSPEVPGNTQKILSILVMGVDQRDPNEAARADVTALVAIDLDTKAIHMISIPRDTRTAIADTNLIRKINYAHATGGPERMVKTVENLLGVPIHYYMETNFEGFANCIDILGGLDYNVEQRMYLPLEGIDLQPRQQAFLSALLDKSLRLTTLPKIPSLVSELRSNLKTDLSVTKMIALAKEFVGVDNLQLQTVTLPGVPDNENYGASYWILDEAACKAIIDEIYYPNLTGTGEGEGTAENTAGTAQ
jgi:LCP family protein required for cell wall assembly